MTAYNVNSNSTPNGAGDWPSKRIVILTDGNTDPLTAKTGGSVLRYRPQDVVAVLDSAQAGKTAGEVLGVGGDTPIVAKLSDVDDADTLLIGIAPAGGRAPEHWRPALEEALKRGMQIISGLHDFLSDDPELVALAEEHGARIWDVRKNRERDVATRQGLTDDCLRVLTIGQDCSVGKMVAAIEIARGLQTRGTNAKFIATGQTGIMIEGDGCPIDCVVSDFVNGAVEKQVLANQHHEVMIIEGQATVSHPRYSSVSTGLLHGSQPHGMIMVYEAGRETIRGMPHLPLPSLRSVIEAYEQLAAFGQPSKVIGFAINTRLLDDAAAEAECQRITEEFGLPAADPIRHGCDTLLDAIDQLQKNISTLQETVS